MANFKIMRNGLNTEIVGDPHIGQSSEDVTVTVTDDGTYQEYDKKLYYSYCYHNEVHRALCAVNSNNEFIIPVQAFYEPGMVKLTVELSNGTNRPACNACFLVVTNGAKDVDANVLPSEKTWQSYIQSYLKSDNRENIENILKNAKEMGVLTINGQQYNGSEDVVVEVASSSGGSTETVQETQLGTGTIVTGTEASTTIDTGITLATLKQYKRFIFVFKGASNVGLQNTYLTFGNSGNYAIARSDSAGGYVYAYEVLNAESCLLRVYSVYQGNPSLIRNIGSNYVLTTVPASFSNANCGGGSPFLIDLSDLEDTDTLKIFISGATKIDYSWEVRGLTA